MDQLGEYQNDIPSLSTLDTKSYERIFKVFKDSLENKEFYYFNILKKIEFPDLDSGVVEYHLVNTRTPMTTVSFDIYGDIKSWWIIYLLNKDAFNGPPFWVEGGTQLKYITPVLRTSIYLDITQNTVYGGRHY